MNRIPNPTDTPQTAAQVRYGDEDTADSEPSRETLIAARRELARWKHIAGEYESRLASIESSPSWRYSAPIRLLAEILPRWKEFALLGLLALITLPLWPAIILMALFKTGRDFLWSGLSRIGPPGKLLQDIYGRLFPSPAIGAIVDRERAVYVLSRTFEDPAESSQKTNNSLRNSLIMTLCPQQRSLLGQLLHERSVIPPHSIASETLSYSSAERRLMMLYATPNLYNRSDS